MSNLNWKTILATSLMTTALVPIAAADTAGAPVCQPQADASAETLPGSPTFYEKEYSWFGQKHVEIWEETNGIPGLQPSSMYTCGAATDTLVESICQGCPTHL